MDLKPLHLHFGPGNLGHGLIAELHDPSQSDLAIAHHSSDSAIAAHLRTGHDLRVRVGTDEPRSIPLFAYVVSDTLEGRQAVIDLVDGRSTVIITSTVGSAQPEVISFLSSLPADLWAGRDVSVIPCENRVHLNWASFGAISGATVFSNLVVDRICTQPDATIPLVTAERYAEFAVERRGSNDTPAVIGATLVDDITFRKRRKLYLVNGLQLALALLALEPEPGRPIDEAVRVDDYLRSDRGSLAIRGLALEYLLAFNWLFAPQMDASGHLEYLETCLERIGQTPDRALRIVNGGSGKPDDWLIGSLTKFDTRLTTPLGEYCQASGAPPRSTLMWRAWTVLKQIIDAYE